MNYIKQIRKEIKEYFNPANEIENSTEVFISPNKKYRVETKAYKQTKPKCNWDVTKVDIFEAKSGELLFSFFTNEGTFYHSWVQKNGIDYLLCAEDLCGGQTVIDLSNRKMVSYSGNNDGFIWTKHLLSPNERLLAVFGCGWGSSSFIITYHFDNPMDLPLKIACEPVWTGYDMIEWIDNQSIRVKQSENKEQIIEIIKHF